ncbi:hypothetical protein BS50DRAFT_323333 [Corynespora cassiicola Philippines]|uniref:Uncharacterized protein n=1 Tax=Corynespora cassiicola Philippines TaxID=1448308 RepID=A0A2T2NTF0_CORCC|nr:hypothetical protein BS50DRAFT_323333 [Corynespora cassiicola Philippines]
MHLLVEDRRCPLGVGAPCDVGATPLLCQQYATHYHFPIDVDHGQNSWMPHPPSDLPPPGCRSGRRGSMTVSASTLPHARSRRGHGHGRHSHRDQCPWTPPGRAPRGTAIAAGAYRYAADLLPLAHPKLQNRANSGRVKMRGRYRIRIRCVRGYAPRR